MVVYLGNRTKMALNWGSILNYPVVKGYLLRGVGARMRGMVLRAVGSLLLLPLLFLVLFRGLRFRAQGCRA